MVLVVQVPVLVLDDRSSEREESRASFKKKVVPSAAPAPRFVGKLPAQDRGLVPIASHEGLDVRLECRLVRERLSSVVLHSL